MNNHWPATYLKLGLTIRSSIAPAVKHVSITTTAIFRNETNRWGERGPSKGELHASHESHAKPSLQSR